MKTIHPPESEVSHAWHLVDAQGQVLGRLATRIALLLRGKGKALFSPHRDCGDFVVVVNAEKVVLTGKKMRNKVYHHHSGYPSGLKTETAEKVLAEHPTRLLERAVRGMLPKTKLGDALYSKLKVYAGPAHPHSAQQPQPLLLARKG